MTFLLICTFAKGGFTTLENKKDTGAIFLYEFRDLLTGAAFPLMLQMILSVTFIGMTSAFSDDDVALALVMLCIGELLIAAAYFIFGRQSGITSVRRLVQNAKKRDIGTNDRRAVLGTGEYSAYKGFVMGLLSCVPYVILQIVQCASANTFCAFMLEYVFGWAALPLTFAKGEVTNWLNLLFVIYPVAVHGLAYMFGAHKEWDKKQKVAELQSGAADIKEDK